MTEILSTHDLGNGITELRLSRAPVNALTVPFLDAFAAALDDLAADDAVRAMVLTSAFKVYSAGVDLKAAQDFSVADQNAIVDALNGGFLTQYTFPKPLVAAITGSAIAGGLFFAIACDWRVARTGTQYGLSEVRVGADLPVGPMEIARAELSPDVLRRMLLTGQPIGAEEALARGVLDQLCEQDKVLDQALAKARELTEIPAPTFARVKRQLRQPAIDVIEAEMARLAASPDRVWFGPETKDAMKRMLG